MTEISFEVTEGEVDGGYSASALGYGIHTQGDSVEEIRANVKEAVDCYDGMPRPRFISGATSACGRRGQGTRVGGAGSVPTKTVDAGPPAREDRA